jgi:hypothetical protein
MTVQGTKHAINHSTTYLIQPLFLKKNFSIHHLFRTWLGAVPGNMPIFATIVATLVARWLGAIGRDVASPDRKGIKHK